MEGVENAIEAEGGLECASVVLVTLKPTLILFSIVLVTRFHV